MFFVIEWSERGGIGRWFGENLEVLSLWLELVERNLRNS
jgi:hypothetical protein